MPIPARLVVVRPFSTYSTADVITDAEVIRAVWEDERRAFVHPLAADSAERKED